MFYIWETMYLDIGLNIWIMFSLISLCKILDFFLKKELR